MNPKLKRFLLIFAIVVIVLSLVFFFRHPEFWEARFYIAFFCFVFPLVLLSAAILLVKDKFDPAIWKPFYITAIVYEILKFILLVYALKIPLGWLIVCQAVLVAILLTTLFKTIKKHKLAKNNSAP